jgi:DNA primase
LVITKSKNLFYCFPSKEGGDQIKLVAHVKELSQKDAAHLIAKHFDPGTVHKTVHRTVQGHSSPPPGPAKTGFDPEQYASRLDPAYDALAPLNLSAETLKAFKSGYAATGSNRGRLALCVHDRDGKIAGFIGRAIGQETPKLVFPNGFRPEAYIFNANRVTEGELYLVRDPLEVLRVHESGVENVVAFLTEGICAQQLEELASLLDSRHCDLVHLY